MTPKEKGEELVLKYLRLQEEGSSNWFHKILAKQCALISVNLLIKETGSKYWYEVKKEINKL